MKLLEPRVWPWTRRDYHEAGKLGWFDRQRVQLVGGEVIEMPAPSHSQAVAIWRTRKAIERVFEPRHWVRQNAPLPAGEHSEPQPDVAVAERGIDEYTDHPDTALLVVEVADSTLRLDRRLAGLYASAGIPEYWIVNLPDQRLEVYRQSIADESAEFGYRYAQQQSLTASGHISPVARPEVGIAVAELLG